MTFPEEASPYFSNGFAVDITTPTSGDVFSETLSVIAENSNDSSAADVTPVGDASLLTSSSNATVAVVKGIILSLIIFLVIFGNLLVIAAVLTNRRLRSSLTHFFVLSLGVADLLLGVIVLPFMMVTIVVHEQRWIFGSTICNLVTCADVTLCTASILNLFLTTCERYIAIVAPFRYQRIITRQNVLIAIGAIWLLSAFCSFVPLHLGWNTVDGAVQNTRPTDDPGVCKFDGNPVYNVTISVTTFFIPLVLLAVANVKILKIAHSQRENIAKQQRTVGDTKRQSFCVASRPSNSNLPSLATTKQSNYCLSLAKKLPPTPPNLPTPTGAGDHRFSIGDQEKTVEVNDALLRDSELDGLAPLPPRRSTTFCRSPSTFTGELPHVGSTLTVATAIRVFTAEHKATITILTIVGFFVACWLPYFVLFTVKPFLDPVKWADFNASNPNFETSLVWLGYFNSLCNPVIYTCLNRQFRVAFARLLRISKSSNSSSLSWS